MTMEPVNHKLYLQGVSRYKAAKLCPWATVIAKTEGGYCAFEYITDYRRWRKQK